MSGGLWTNSAAVIHIMVKAIYLIRGTDSNDARAGGRLLTMYDKVCARKHRQRQCAIEQHLVVCIGPLNAMGTNTW